MEEAKENKRRRVPWWLIAGAVVLAGGLLLPLVRGGSGGSSQDVSLRTFAEQVEAGQGDRIIVKGDTLTLERPDGSSIESRKEEGIGAIETLQQLGVAEEAIQEIEIEVQGEGGGLGSVVLTFVSLAPLLFFVLLGFFLFRQLRNSGGGVFGVGKSKPRVTGVDGKRPPVSFEDIAGEEEAKRELQEVVQFLKSPERFARLGARIPRGVLLVGPPGTGKTLLARVRDLFEKAKAAAPSIIFVDEIDAVGRRRGVGLGGGNDEREQTLNQILVEMDGFEGATKVIVVAATNRADVLDPALLRPGRFDRRVIVDLPDAEGREAILGVHSKGKVLAHEVDLAAIGKLTVGFAGADLENLMNEAAILAARTGEPAIGTTHLDQAFERIVAGPQRSRNIMDEGERRTVAYHEAGHALVMESMPKADPVHKVSIVSRGAALGYTMPIPEKDKVLRSQDALEDEIAGLLGGRAAEELYCDGITTGAANDIERATSLAKAMVTQYGMSEELGLRTFESGETSFPDWSAQQRDYAEGTALKIDSAITRILDRGYERAKSVLKERWKTLSAIAGALLDQETLERSDIDRLLAESTQEHTCPPPGGGRDCPPGESIEAGASFGASARVPG